MFRAISYAVFGTPDHHVDVRLGALQWIEANTHRYVVGPGLESQWQEAGGATSWVTYLAYMRVLGHFGDALTLTAAQFALQIRIRILSSAEGAHAGRVRYVYNDPPLPAASRSWRDVTLAYVARRELGHGEHYNYLAPL